VNPLFAQVSEPNRLIDSIARTPLSKIIILAVICTAIRLLLFPFLRKVPMHLRTGLYPVLNFVNESLDAIVYAAVLVFLVIRPFGVQMFQIPSGSMENTLLVNDFIVANKAVYRYSDPKVGDIIVFRPPRGAINDLKMLDSQGRVNQDFIKRCVGVPGDVVEVKYGALYRNGKRVEEPYLKDQNFFGAFKLVDYKGDYPNLKGKVVPVFTDGDVITADSIVNNHTPGGYSMCRDYAIGLDRVEVNPETQREELVFKPILDNEDLKAMRELASAPPAKIPPGHYLMFGDNRNACLDARNWGLIERKDIVGRSEAIVFPFKRWRVTR
jgi:signal peptidase I